MSLPIDPLWIFVYLLLGMLVGFAAGLLGVGGGGIMVPVFTALFAMQNFPEKHLLHTALATSMASIIPTSLSSLRAHSKHDAVVWKVVFGLSPGIILGTFFSSFLTSYISSRFLAVIFAVFMAYVSFQMFLNIKPKPQRELPGITGLSLTGIGIGSISALVAIGGGSLTVPFLTWCNVKIQKAIGTSAAVGLPIAVTGSIGYLAAGWNAPNVPYTLGYIYLPAVVCVSFASFFTAPLGATLTHSLPVTKIKRIFAGLLLFLCLKMLHTIFA